MAGLGQQVQGQAQQVQQPVVPGEVYPGSNVVFANPSLFGVGSFSPVTQGQDAIGNWTFAYKGRAVSVGIPTPQNIKAYGEYKAADNIGAMLKVKSEMNAAWEEWNLYQEAYRRNLSRRGWDTKALTDLKQSGEAARKKFTDKKAEYQAANLRFGAEKAVSDALKKYAIAAYSKSNQLKRDAVDDGWLVPPKKSKVARLSYNF